MPRLITIEVFSTPVFVSSFFAGW